MTSVQPRFFSLFKCQYLRCLLKVKSHEMNNLKHSSVGIVIIGDEILKGQVADTNSNFLCRELYRMGLHVPQVSIIPDDIEMIAKTVKDFSQRYTFVLTTGGIGPTHDDITYEGVARAFEEDLVKHREVSSVIGRWCEIFGVDRTAAERMEMVPKSSEVHMINIGIDGLKNFPMISVQNVYIYPGIPSYLKKLFDKTKNIFAASTTVAFQCSTLYSSASEFYITKALNETVDMFKGKVRFGSYPATMNEPYRVKITLEADDEIDLQEAEGFLRNVIPQDCLVGPYEPGSEKSIEEVYQLSDPDLKDLVKESISLLEECFRIYSPGSIYLSFNGGKDCTVLLHLAVNVLNKLHGPGKQLNAFYIKQEDTFQEIDEFVNLAVKRYNLNMCRLSGELKPALLQLSNQNPELKAVLIGTRRTDPRSVNLQALQPTDSDWPPLMRVSPLLDWGYQHVWQFLRTLHVPYCSLYNQGYTSLGSKSNTECNPQLKVERSGRTFFQPAYLLKEPSEERNGRN